MECTGKTSFYFHKYADVTLRFQGVMLKHRGVFVNILTRSFRYKP